MNTEKIFLRCKHCDVTNRIPVSQIYNKPVCGKCKKPISFVREPIEVSDLNYKTEVLDNPGFTLVEFWSAGCGYCSMINPILDQIAGEMAGLLKVVKINTINGRRIAAEHQINGVPALFIYQNSKRLAKSAGAMTKIELKNWIKNYTGI